MKRKPDPEPSDEAEGGGLSPSALVVYISPDMIGLWRLRKSLARDDARWFYDAGRKIEASVMIRAALGCHRQIMRILIFKRTGVRSTDSMRFAQNFRFDAPLRTEPEAIERSAPRPQRSKPGPKRKNSAAPAHPVRKLSKRLTPREKEIARFIGLGLSNSEIGKRVNLGPATIAAYVCNVRKKVGAADRSGLAVWARQQGEGARA